MARCETGHLDEAPVTTAPDGSLVRELLSLAGGSMAQFTLPPGETSIAAAHRTVEEIWFITAGNGAMWRCRQGEEQVDPLRPGTCLSIPVGTAFQFRSLGTEPLVAIGITMPPWPGPDEAVRVDGRWLPTVR
ncbi:MAG: cupin domain-containing protein [Chloroflexi bacterium]|nr:cupin domain-containing protein [Chloroflexota bacterium]